MKKYLISSFVLLCGIVPLASAQLVDSRTFFVQGVTDVAASGSIQFWKTSATTGEVKLFIDNLSVYKALNHTLTGYENGVLTGFAFNVGSGFNYINHSFTETLLGPIAGLATGSEPWGLDFSYTGSTTVGGGPNAETFESSAFADNPSTHNGLSGGYSALFTFNYSASSAANLTNNFNSAGFFSDADTKDIYFRYQAVGSGCGDEQSDKVFWGWASVPTPDPFIPNSPVPEPSTYGLTGVAALGALILVRRYRKK